MGTSASSAIKARIRNIIAACAAFALSLALAPTMSAADESVAGALATRSAAELVPLGVAPEVNGDAQSASPNSILASTLTSDGVSVISADVMLGDTAASEGSNTVIGSFTVDGLTFAVTDDGGVTLVAVSPDSVGASYVLAPYENPADSGDDNAIAVPPTVTYAGITYPVTAIGSYAFYLSGATQASLPASITSVDDRAFRSSDVEWVTVDANNPNLASFDGCLYDSQLLSLLLIPEGRAGVVLLPSETEVAEPSKFSHCSLVEAIDVEEGDAAFASWDGLLYDASGTTLLRVPAGATEITIREGCTTIAAGAMEGCAKLERINAPATVTSISPNVFESVSTIALPSNVILSGDAERSGASPFREATEGAEVEESPSQLTALVALTDGNGITPPINASSIAVSLSRGTLSDLWTRLGFTVEEANGLRLIDSATGDNSRIEELDEDDGESSIITLRSGATYAADSVVVDGNGGTLNTFWENCPQKGNTANSVNYGSGTYSSFTFNGYTIEVYNNRINCWSQSPSIATEGRHTAGYYDYFQLTPSRTGYTFTGWTGSVNVPATGTASATLTNGTVKAAWSANSYVLTLNGNGGKVWGADSWSTTNPKITFGGQQWNTVSTASRAGYTFKGYYTATSGGTQVYDANGNYIEGTAYWKNSFWCYAGNPTLYAQWTANSIICSWNSQGGTSVSNTSATFSASAEVPMPSSNPTKPGHTFAGWWTAASGGTQVTSSTSLPSENVTYYAHWTPKSYDLTLDGNGGTIGGTPRYSTTNNPNLKKLIYGKQNWIDVPGAVRDGYTFTGYYTASSGGTKIYAPIADGRAYVTNDGNYWKDYFWSYDGDATFYAQWNANTIKCSWDSQGGSSIAATSATYSTSAKVPMPAADPTKQGYAFMGWWTEPDGGDKVTAATPLPTEDATYYAHWVPALSVDVPLEVTARVDLLGIDEQTEASGYLESRSAGALEVAAIGFTPLAGATELFESNVSNVFLEALTDSTVDADVSFALSAAATETDADALAAFALPDGYGSRVGIAYRFAIPDDVLATIDQARFAEVTTPVGQVVYTVALAG